jgi:hypothetical protein
MGETAINREIDAFVNNAGTAIGAKAVGHVGPFGKGEDEASRGRRGWGLFGVIAGLVCDEGQGIGSKLGFLFMEHRGSKGHRELMAFRSLRHCAIRWEDNVHLTPLDGQAGRGRIPRIGIQPRCDSNRERAEDPRDPKQESCCERHRSEATASRAGGVQHPHLQPFSTEPSLNIRVCTENRSCMA